MQLRTRKKKDGTTHITPEGWANIVDVYRKHDGAIGPVCHELGWLEARTRRIFMRGLPKKGFRAIRDILDDDKIEVRAARAREMERTGDITIDRVPDASEAVVIASREQRRLQLLVEAEEHRKAARADAVKARTEESLLIGMNRRNAIALNGVTAQLMRGAVALSAKIEQELTKAAEDDELSLSEKLKLVRSAASVARFNSEATMLAIKSERMVLGQPIESIPETPDDGSLENAVKWIEQSVRAVNRARERGLLRSSNDGT